MLMHMRMPTPLHSYAGTLSNKRQPNDAGELGRDDDPLVPGLVGGLLAGVKVVAVAAGREHAVVADVDGKVWTWGGRDLLTGRKGDLKHPGRAMVSDGLYNYGN